jgi:transcriptional regulator with XRE-family HTH domain
MKRKKEAIIIGTMIQESRKLNHQTHQDFADAVALGPQFVKEIEYAYKNPSVPSLFRIITKVEASPLRKFLRMLLPPELAKAVVCPEPPFPTESHP